MACMSRQKSCNLRPMTNGEGSLQFRKPERKEKTFYFQFTKIDISSSQVAILKRQETVNCKKVDVKETRQVRMT